MKKIAYLISAYTEPLTLLNLINELNSDEVDFYIHIDKKKKISDFKMINSMNNVYYLPDDKRVRVHWGGYSQCVYQYNSIKYMLSKGINYKRVINLSATDYPVVSNDKLIELFDTEQEFIEGFDINNGEYLENSQRPPHKDRLVYYYKMDSNKLIRGLTKKLKIKRVKNIKEFGYDFFYGSEYWGLTLECLKYIIDYYERDKKLRKILKHSFVPSEMWIHTIFFNSKYKDRGISYSDWNHRELQYLSPLVFFDYRGKVKVLSEIDYDDIIASGKPFARKVIVGKSDGLIKKIKESKV